MFSGSLSYLFNNFSVQNRLFSEVLKEAIENGYTEPDPREDLCGNDVGRKLLILARELDLQNEFRDVIIQNLIPENLRAGSSQEFLGKLKEMDAYYQQIKDNQKAGHVLRYIGDLSGDLQQDKGVLEVKLISVPQTIIFLFFAATRSIALFLDPLVMINLRSLRLSIKFLVIGVLSLIINKASKSESCSIASASSTNGSLKILNSYFPESFFKSTNSCDTFW